MENIIESSRRLVGNGSLYSTWVQKIWVENGFTEFEDFPSEYMVEFDETTIDDIIREFIDSLASWFSEGGTTILRVVHNRKDSSNIEDDVYSWRNLEENEIDGKELACLFGMFILQYKKEPLNSSFFKTALLSSLAYLNIVAIPDSNVFQLFNPVLFSHVADIIKLSCEIIIGKPKDTGKRKHNVNDEDDDDEYMLYSLLTNEKPYIIRVLLDIIDLLMAVFENNNIKIDDDTLQIAVQCLIQICRVEQSRRSFIAEVTNGNPKQYRTKPSETFLSYQSYMLLLRLCVVLYNDPSKVILFLVKEFVPILSLVDVSSISTPSKESSVVRSHATEFICTIMNAHPNDASDAINILIQRLCAATPERAELRQKSIPIIWEIITRSPKNILSRIIYSIVFLSYMNDSKVRLFTLELITKILTETWDFIPANPHFESKLESVVCYKFLLSVVFSKCLDTSINVRTKSLACVEVIVNNDNNIIKPLLDEIFETGDLYPFFDTHRYMIGGDIIDVTSKILPSGPVVLNLLYDFCTREKTFVRNAAFKALENILIRYPQWIVNPYIEAFYIGCNDNSVLIRKTVVPKLTNLLIKFPERPDLIKLWVKGVVTLSAEEEQKAQEKMSDTIISVIFRNIKPFHISTTVLSRLPWLIVNEIMAQGMRNYLDYIIYKWAELPSILNEFTNRLWTHVDTVNNIGAWCILASIVKVVTIPNPIIIYQYFLRIQPQLDTCEHGQFVIEVLFWVCNKLRKETREKLLYQMNDSLIQCSIPLKLISRYQDICQIIIENLVSEREKRRAIMDWSKDIVLKCEEYILKSLKNLSCITCEDDETGELLVKRIFLIGELGMIASQHISENVESSLRHALCRPYSGNDLNIEFMKPLIVVTLVKLALQRESYSAKLLPILSSILRSKYSSSSLQINSVVGICDLCSRYASLVEPYLPNITLCFKSEFASVRLVALQSLMKQVREDYIKLHYWIMYPLYMLMVDPDDKVLHLINLYMEVDFKDKPGILDKFFVGFFLFLNGSVSDLKLYGVNKDVINAFALENDSEKRRDLYLLVLNKLADTHKRINVTKSIYHDILEKVAGKQKLMSNRTLAIVGDIMYVLYHNEKKIGEHFKERGRTTTENDDIDTQELEDMLEEDGGSSKKSEAAGLSTAALETLRIDAVVSQTSVNINLWKKARRAPPFVRDSFIQYLAELVTNCKPEVVEPYLKHNEINGLIESNLKYSKELDSVVLPMDQAFVLQSDKKLIVSIPRITPPSNDHESDNDPPSRQNALADGEHAMEVEKLIVSIPRITPPSNDHESDNDPPSRQNALADGEHAMEVESSISNYAVQTQNIRFANGDHAMEVESSVTHNSVNSHSPSPKPGKSGCIMRSKQSPKTNIIERLKKKSGYNRKDLAYSDSE